MRKIIAVVVLSAIAVTGAATGAQAKSKVGKADRAAMSRANDTCWAITDDSTFENCVIGAFVLDRGRAVTDADYTYNSAGRIVLTHASRKIG
jgi:hypothetical protein